MTAVAAQLILKQQSLDVVQEPFKKSLVRADKIITEIIKIAQTTALPQVLEDYKKRRIFERAPYKA